MTDVADWTGVAAGPARIASTQAFSLNPGASRTFNVPVEFTERSLVLLGNQGGVGQIFSTQILVVGHVTSALYLEAQWWQSLSISGDLPPITVPAYGVADTSVDVTVTNKTAATVLNYQIWVVAVPDEVMVGSSADPINSTPGAQPLGPPGAAVQPSSNTPYDLVTLINPLLGGGAGIMGVPGNPMSVKESTRGASGTSGVAIPVAPAVLVAAPAAGSIRVVDSLFFLSITAGQVLTLNPNGAGGVNWNGAANMAPVYPAFRLSAGGGGLTVSTTVANGFAYAAWHDEVQ